MKKVWRIPVSVIALMLASALSAGAEEINLVGTDNAESIFKAVGEAFGKANPDVIVKVPESIDSGGGIKAVATGAASVARVARDFNETEKAYGLTYVPFGKVQIAFFTHKAVGVKNLTGEQVRDIFSGAIGNWKDRGGPDMKIRVVTREEGDSALETVEECIPGFDDVEVTTKSKVVYSDKDAADIVSTKEGTIAFGAFGAVKDADVAVLTIDGKAPDAGEYACAHPVGLVFKEANRTGVIGKFIEFTTSAAAHEAIRRAGGQPLQ